MFLCIINVIFLPGRDCIFSFSGLKNSLFIHVAREEERVDLQPGEMLPTASDIAARYEASLELKASMTCFGGPPLSVNFPSPMYDWTKGWTS